MFYNQFGRQREEAWFDTMQVCESGHQITAMLKAQPENARSFCELCGAKTLSACSGCNSPIPGYKHHGFQVRVPVPSRCGSCGRDFPWTVPTDAKHFIALVESFNRFIENSSTISIWRISLDTYSRIGTDHFPHPCDLCATLYNFYSVVRASLQRDRSLTESAVLQHVKHFTVLLRSYESAIKDVVELHQYVDKGVIGKSYSALATAFNEWAKDFEEFLDSRKQPHTFMRFPALAELPTKPAPVQGGQRAYAPGDAYQFFKDVRDIVAAASKEVFIIEPYPNEEVFELYLEKVPVGVPMRVLWKTNKNNFLAVGKKFMAKNGVKFEARQSAKMHDRLIFVDGRCWIIGKSFKDAAIKDPTYVAEVPDMAVDSRIQYDEIWNAATPTNF